MPPDSSIRGLLSSSGPERTTRPGPGRMGWKLDAASENALSAAIPPRRLTLSGLTLAWLAILSLGLRSPSHRCHYAMARVGVAIRPRSRR
jgi:hypothetical protein